MRHIISLLYKENFSLNSNFSHSTSHVCGGCLHGVACYHHAADLHRFFTNRYHKKLCPCCSRPNILPATNCWKCSQPLTNIHIRSIGRDALRDLIMARHVNHDQSKKLETKIQFLKTQTNKSESFFVKDHFLQGLPQPLAAAHHGLGNPSVRFIELFRSFSFIVAVYPFPIGMIHLVSIPKASVYDIKQLRRSHIPLLKNMKERTKTLARLMLEFVLLPIHENPSFMKSKKLKSNASETEAGREETTEMACDETKYNLHQQIKEQTIFGFNYPSEYGQLCMHAIIPPIYNFSLFEAPYFYPLNKILKELEVCGSPQVIPPSTILRYNSKP